MTKSALHAFCSSLRDTPTSRASSPPHADRHVLLRRIARRRVDDRVLLLLRVVVLGRGPPARGTLEIHHFVDVDDPALRIVPAAARDARVLRRDDDDRAPAPRATGRAADLPHDLGEEQHRRVRVPRSARRPARERAARPERSVGVVRVRKRKARRRRGRAVRRGGDVRSRRVLRVQGRQRRGRREARERAPGDAGVQRGRTIEAAVRVSRRARPRRGRRRRRGVETAEHARTGPEREHAEDGGLLGIERRDAGASAGVPPEDVVGVRSSADDGRTEARLAWAYALGSAGLLLTKRHA
mmetsp:Transcript_6153/g.22504  ORF Transcript_6153/g.22504 Transcript_6153/m.22504 type:complete len:298 (-) Transcript_6153:2973-3866(-)